MSVVKYVIFFNIFATVTHLTNTGGGVATFGYNNRSLQTATTLANGVIEAKAYDADSQLLSMELTKDAISLYKRTQSYNLVGDVTQRGTATNGAALTLENFTYDPVSRLTEHKADAGNQSLNSYGYNTVGNLIEVGNKNQTYDAVGKVTATGSTDVTYDARNNRTALIDTVDATNNVEYTWAQNNLLAEVTSHKDSTPVTVSYAYGAGNLLQARTEGASTQQFVWDTSRAIPAMLSDGKYEYVYSQDRVPLAQIEVSTGIVTYLHKDLTGSVTASTDATGGLVGTVDYSPYGVATRSLLSHFGYAGEWVDSVTGYSYLKARWLDTKTGTFLSEDPLVQMTNNAFGYTEGNPITQIDPLGLFINPVGTMAALWDTDWNAVGNDAKNFGMDVWRNSGNISATLGITGLFLDGTIAGLPVGLILGLGSIAFGVAGLTYDVGNCVGYLNDADCNPGMIALDILGLGTGGVGLMLGKSALAAKTVNAHTNLSNASVLAGFGGAAVGIAMNLLNAINAPQTAEDDFDDCKKTTMILL